MGFNQKKIALVTGANKGLGLEISRQLAQQGIKVVMVVRNITKGQVAMHQATNPFLGSHNRRNRIACRLWLCLTCFSAPQNEKDT
jgi:NAD(P)-dependent dehydrogenase (short-subunit alcohol dehydrogenase family)